MSKWFKALLENKIVDRYDIIPDELKSGLEKETALILGQVQQITRFDIHRDRQDIEKSGTEIYLRIRRTHKRLFLKLSLLFSYLKHDEIFLENARQELTKENNKTLQRNSEQFVAYRAEVKTIQEALEKCIGDKMQELKDLEDRLTQTRQEILSQSAEIDDAKNFATQKAGEVETILQAAKDNLARLGVSGFAKIFGNEATASKEQATRWLRVATGVAVSTFLYLGVIFCVHYFSDSTTLPIAKLVELGIVQLAIFSVLTYLLIFSAKTYKAHLHNQAINSHRRNALATFEEFMLAAKGDDATRNAVLLQTTQAIFQYQSPGFIGAESEPPAPFGAADLIKLLEKQR